MINVFKLKKWGSFLFIGLFTVICFFVGLNFYGFLIALACMTGGLIVACLVANLMLKSPFSDMLEGKGILVMNLDSTGIIRFSIVGLSSPYIKGKLGKKSIGDVWDRSTVMQIEAPKKNITPAVPNKKGGITFELDQKEFNDARFALFHYPVLIWNDQIESLVTKDFLAEKEKGTFAEHGVLFLNRRIEELTSKVRDFARYVVESTKPQKSGLFQNKWFWIIFIIMMIIMAILFAPAIISAIQGFMGTSAGAMTTATSGTNPIVPR